MFERQISVIKALRDYYAQGNPLVEGLLKKARERVLTWEGTLPRDAEALIEHLIRRVEKAETANHAEELRALQQTHNFKREQYTKAAEECQRLAGLLDHCQQNERELAERLHNSERWATSIGQMLRDLAKGLSGTQIIDVLLKPPQS